MISRFAMHLATAVAVVTVGLALVFIASGPSPSLQDSDSSANDTLERATPIESLPFLEDTVNLPAVPLTPDELRASCMSPSHTAWYALTPESDVPLTTWVVPELDGAAPIDVALAAWVETPDGSLEEAGCSNDRGAGGPEQLVMALGEDRTYFLQASAVDQAEPGDGTVTFLADVQLPEHDLFAFARRVGTTPFHDVDVDAIAARREPGERVPSCADLDATTWYGVSSPEDATLAATVTPSGGADNAMDVAIVLHAGGTLDSLVEKACVDAQGVQIAEHLEVPIFGGQDYWIEVGAVLSENAGPGVYTLMIDGIQTIDLRPLPDTVLGAAPVAISAEANSGLPVAFEVSGPCHIRDGALIATGAGLCTVVASQLGDGEWAPAAPVTTTLRIGRGRQAIELEPITGASVGQPVAVDAEAASGLPVTLEASGPCRVVDAVLLADGAGTCTVTASQAGDADWAPAEPVTSKIRVSRGRQTIELTPLGATTVAAEPIPLPATTDAGLPLVLEADGPCELEGDSLRVLGSGTCTVTASQAGDADWAPAEPVSADIAIAPAAQSIELAPLPAESAFGDPPLRLSATSDSGLPLVLEASGSCQLEGRSLRATGAGTCTVTASQAGDADWAPAEPVSADIAIAPAAQSIELAPIERAIVGETVEVAAEAGSGLPVAVAASGPCLIEGDSLRVLGSGTCTVTASQAGDADWAPAEPVSASLRIGRGRQSIELAPLTTDTVFGADPLEIGAEASSGLPVAVDIEGPCQLLDGGLVSTGAGTCTVTASQAGDADWRPAEPVSADIAIAPAAQSIELAPIARKLLGEDPIELEATSTSGLPITFSASGPCRADDGVLILLEKGRCTVTASQPGNADWAAGEASTSFRIVAPIQGRRPDFTDVATASPPGARVGHGARITSTFEPGGPEAHYYAVALDEAEVLGISGIEAGTAWSIAGPTDLAADEDSWQDIEVDADTGVASWIASESGVHSIRVADVSTGSDPKPSYTMSVSSGPGIDQVLTQEALEEALLERLRPIRCQALREDEDVRPFINGAVAGAKCHRPMRGVYDLRLYTFADEQQLRAFFRARVDEVRPALRSSAAACQGGQPGVRPWEHGKIACWIPTGRSRGSIHWTDERTNTYGIIRALVDDNRQRLRSWRELEPRIS